VTETAIKRIEIPYQPRPLQRLYHDDTKRWSLLVCHRRFGKTVMSICELIKRAMQKSFRRPGGAEERPRYAYIAPTYRQAKSIAWDYLKHFSATLPGCKANESELRIDFQNGSRISLYGADNPDSLRGIYLDGVVLDEYGQMSPSLLGEIVRPALSDRKGWATFIGTFKGQNAFYRLYQQAKADPDWYVALHKASDTGIIPADELADAKKLMSDAEYEQEYECSPLSALKGAVYGDHVRRLENAGRIKQTKWEQAAPVYTVWDLGYRDATAIIFYQLIERDIVIIDHYEATQQSLIQNLKVVKDRPYIYGDHFAPHDIKYTSQTTGKTRYESALEFGIRFRVLEKPKVSDGIEQARAIFDRLVINEKCTHLLECLKHIDIDGTISARR